MKPGRARDTAGPDCSSRFHSALTSEGGAGSTYGETAARQLRALCGALGIEDRAAEYVRLQDALFEPWGGYQVPCDPQYPSMIGDDHSPYEYSLAFSGSRVELRILFEAQAKNPSLKSNRVAAELVNERLRTAFGVDFSRFDRVRDLFLPDEPQGPFTLWHAVCLNVDRPPEFKVYLNPAVRGPTQTGELVTEALHRLGFGRAASRLLGKIARRGVFDDIRYFSLDLSAERTARVKIYFGHSRVTAEDLETAFSFAPSHRRGDVEAFCDAIAGSRGPFTRKHLTSCFAFVAGNNRPSAVTLHFPIAHYVSDDEIAAARISAYMERHGFPVGTYSRAVRALAGRALDWGAGLQSYASYRREGDATRLTVYLSPELFSTHDETSRTRMRATDS